MSLNFAIKFFLAYPYPNQWVKYSIRRFSVAIFHVGYNHISANLMQCSHPEFKEALDPCENFPEFRKKKYRQQIDTAFSLTFGRFHA